MVSGNNIIILVKGSPLYLISMRCYKDRIMTEELIESCLLSLKNTCRADNIVPNIPMSTFAKLGNINIVKNIIERINLQCVLWEDE